MYTYILDTLDVPTPVAVKRLDALKERSEEDLLNTALCYTFKNQWDKIFLYLSFIRKLFWIHADHAAVELTYVDENELH